MQESPYFREQGGIATAAQSIKPGLQVIFTLKSALPDDIFDEKGES